MEAKMTVDIEDITDIKLDEKVKQVIKEPKKWHVFFLNDDHTPMEFVISILTEIYHHSTETAKNITLQIHETGSGIAGTYSFDIAEIKTIETTNIARANGFPLQTKLEEE
jgi:ATP-dependent Clp protease adaptor protein ClpS